MASYSEIGTSAVRHVQQAGELLGLGISDAAHMAGRILVRQAQNGILAKDKSGRIYLHPDGGTYRASAPGQYSANVTGELLNSINYSVAGATSLTFYADAKHAGYQEDGTTRMQARGNLGNAIRDTTGQVHQVLAYVSWRKFTGGAG